MSKNLRPKIEDILKYEFPLEAREDRVIIYPDEVPKVTETGIIIPEVAQGKPSTGIVVEVGPGRKDEQGILGIILKFLVWMFRFKNTTTDVPNEFTVGVSSIDDIKRGDHVMYGRYAGSEVEWNGTWYLVVRQSDIMIRNRVKK